jgi:hypothetical protein
MTMVLCPVALAVGCRRCPAFPVCPLKSVIGNHKPDEAAPAKREERPPTRSAPPRKSGANRKGARARRGRK